MTRIWLILAIGVQTIAGCAAKQRKAAPAPEPAPPWIQEAQRSALYPSTEWYTGFARDRADGSPGKAEHEAIEKAAQNRLSESIIVQIQGTTTVESASHQERSGQNVSETIKKNYMQEITSRSNAVLAKMETHSHFDKQSGYIYGFSAVRKKDLADFYMSNINTLFSFAEREFAIADQLAEQGRNKAALDKVYATEDSLRNVGYWGFLLQLVENNNSYMVQERDFWQMTGNMKARLRNATKVYLDISGNGEHDFAERLSAQMQEKGCNCTIAEEREGSDYLVAIEAKLSRCTEGTGLVFCYANAAVVVNNLRLGRPVSVKIPEAKGGWPNGNKDKAMEETFKKLTSSLAEKINQAINQ
ncbi:MAG: hypothetical protein LBC85_00355 [Fibromonadaceae bacterium]|nr:hypothetical protein [Fibromonadaceae bacterium]